MAHWFTQDFIDFFLELEKNNTKEWFDANRKRYEKSVKNPFSAFTQAFINEVGKDNPELQQDAKNCTFRINRDIRFSKDKTPYKTTASAIITVGGKKNHHIPGYYFELSAHNLHFGGGAYFLETAQLADLRYSIANAPDEFLQLISNTTFVNEFGHLQGETAKRLPADLVDVAGKIPLLYNKQFYFMKEIPVSVLLSNDLLGYFTSLYFAAKPVNSFLKKGLFLD